MLTPVIQQAVIPIDPKSVTIPVGGTVNWTNNDNIAHQTISGTAKAVSNVFDTGESHTVVFKKVGTSPYYDDFCCR
jgi:plastocyanin